MLDKLPYEVLLPVTLVLAGIAKWLLGRIVKRFDSMESKLDTVATKADLLKHEEVMAGLASDLASIYTKVKIASTRTEIDVKGVKQQVDLINQQLRSVQGITARVDRLEDEFRGVAEGRSKEIADLKVIAERLSVQFVGLHQQIKEIKEKLG